MSSSYRSRTNRSQDRNLPTEMLFGIAPKPRDRPGLKMPWQTLALRLFLQTVSISLFPDQQHDNTSSLDF
jgi:hypothetical protein